MADRPRRLPPGVGQRLGPFYVYLLVDPRTDEPFYVGMGQRDRLMGHGVEADLQPDPGESQKLARIRAIRRTRAEPIVDIVRHNLKKQEALLVEAALIDCLPNLTNKVRGHDAARGRAHLAEYVTRYGARPLTALSPPVLMIRLTDWKAHVETIEAGYKRGGHGWRPDMSPAELYDAVRGWWKVSPSEMDRIGVKHFVAVAEGVSRAIYEIDQIIGPRKKDGRWAFTGRRLQRGRIWESYVGPWGKRIPFTSRSAFIYWPPRELRV